MENTHFYIFTGGPGSGKSTVLNMLANMGYTTIKEVGRSIIQKQLETEGDAVPWANTLRYAHLMLLRSIVDFEEYSHINRPCFFDRGILDTLGYSRLINIQISKELEIAARQYRYNRKIFLFPFWEDIYINDTERKQSIKEAQETYRVIKNTYAEFDYQPLIVPCISPQERVKWIIKNIQEI